MLKSLALRVLVALPTVLTSATALAGGGGGSGGTSSGLIGAPEPAFWTMCAVVAGTECGRRLLRRGRK
jgi:hypothetical protein